MNDRTVWKDGGTWLKDLRLAAEITERELAEQIGAPTALWVEQIETGRRAVPAAFHRGYARTFAIPVADFVARCFDFYGPDARLIDAAA